jgi:hypothetical protein
MRTQLQTQGFAVTPVPLLDAATRQALHARYEALFRGDFDTGVYPDEWHWRAGLSLPEVTREICNGWKADRYVAEIVLSAALAALVAEIQGWTSVRIGQDDVIWKPPQANASNSISGSSTTSEDAATTQQQQPATIAPPATTVGFHRDSDYISKQFQPYENSSVTLWMALDEADAETGCLEYVPGSQWWDPRIANDEESATNSLSFFSAPDSSSSGNSSSSHPLPPTESHRRSLPTKMAGTTPTIVRQPCPAGHAMLHHQDVWHGSGPNLSTTRHRRALVVHYLNGQVQWKDERPTTATSPPWQTSTYIYGRYRRTGTVELEDDFFPILYASPESDRARTAWLDPYLAGA